MKQFIRRLFLSTYIVILLAFMRGIIICVPFRHIAKRLITYSGSSNLSLKQQSGYARLIGRSVARISRYTPWQSKCLAQGLATKILLRHFKIANTLILGVSLKTDTEFTAHAWVIVDNIIIVGGGNTDQYTAIKSFSDQDHAPLI